MNSMNRTLETVGEELEKLISRSLMVDKSKVFPVSDTNDFLTEFFNLIGTNSRTLISAGLLSADSAIAVDKSHLSYLESVAKSPFSINMTAVTEDIKSPADIIFLCNPNRITGSNFSLSDIEKAARAVPQGFVIVDEFYFDFFGISAIPLLDIFTNIVILRSFTAPFGIYSSDAGYAVAGKEMITNFKNNLLLKRISPILRKTILASLMSEDALSTRLSELHDESLRLSTTLTRLGVQCRITAADFLLLRVASPKDVGNALAAVKVTVENLGGYPQMKKYIKYRIESHFTNERLINAFSKMPSELYKLKGLDLRSTTIKNKEDKKKTHQKNRTSPKALNNLIKSRKKSVLVNN